MAEGRVQVSRPTPPLGTPEKAKGVDKGDGYKSELERKHAQQLEIRRQTGEIRKWWYEPAAWNLGGGTKYRPDFMVLNNDWTIEFHETKGHWREAAKVRIKIASSKFPFRFVAVQCVKGKWTFTEF